MSLDPKTHRLQFEKKVGLTLMSIVPQKAIVKKPAKEGQREEHTDEWLEFIKLLGRHQKVKVIIEWESELGVGGGGEQKL